MKKISLIFFTLIIPQLLNAECGVNKNAIVFANGTFNDRVGAYQSLANLWYYAPKYASKANISMYLVAYNTNEFALAQLYQVFQQKLRDSNVGFWESFGRLIPILKDSKTFNAIQLISGFDLNDADLREQIDQYEKLLNKNLNVVIVAHSQGNFYTNRAVYYVKNPNSFDGLNHISVATPAAAETYFTFLSDGVIKFIPGAPDPNIRKANEGFFDHEFVAHYMADNGARDKIMKSVVSSFAPKTSESDRRDISPFSKTYNSDMNKMLQWLNEKYDSAEDWNVGECYLAETIFYVGSIVSQCEEANLNKVKESLAACIRNDFEGWGTEKASCGYNPSQLLTIRLSYPSEYRNFYTGKREFCNFGVSEIEKNHKVGAEQALEIISKYEFGGE